MAPRSMVRSGLGLFFDDQKSASEKVRPKQSYFSSPWEYAKLPFSLRVPKNVLFKRVEELIMFSVITRYDTGCE
jgi:hypothetical protein